MRAVVDRATERALDLERFVDMDAVVVVDGLEGSRRRAAICSGSSLKVAVTFP